MESSSATAYLEDLADKYDYFFFDWDGVLYSGGKIVERSKEAIDYIREKSKSTPKHLFFITNSSGNTQKMMKSKLGKLGIEIDESEAFRYSNNLTIL
jgi:4-nitrophenyl phosphatase